MSNTKNKADWLLRLSCVITQTDVERVMACGDRHERYRILRHARSLIIAFIVTGTLWGFAFSAILPLWAAIAVGLLVGTIIYLIYV